MPVAVGRAAAKIAGAGEADLTQVAEVFAAAFAESIRRVYGRAANPPAITELFRLFLVADREAFLVAREEERVIGYCFAPERIRRLWGAFFAGGFAWRWAVGFFTGRLGLGWAELRRLLPDKFAFLAAAARSGLGRDARILSIGVRPDRQSQGIGRALVEAALARFDRLGVPAVQLEVRPGNGPALHLYTSLGFRETGRTRDTQGEWVVMSRRLAATGAGCRKTP